jgi:hypothetical protein
MLTFKTLLEAAGVPPPSVRMLRHQDNRYPGYPTPYILWRDHRDRFEAYQGTQDFGNAARLRAPYWASFVGLSDKETMFVGLYAAKLLGPLPTDRLHPVTGGVEDAGSCDLYDLTLLPTLNEFSGRLWIEWGSGYRSWIQRADGMAKPIVELRRRFSEPAFPGFAELIVSLSDIETLPTSWAAALGSTRDVYLLTCPKTREQYVGIASGSGGFLARWREYYATGHGGNVALKARDRSDYRISILQTVGTAVTEGELLALEARWKDKLQSREMGLNRN